MPRVKWKVIDGHSNYEVSTMGEVRNKLTGFILKPYNVQHAWDIGLCNRKRCCYGSRKAI